MSTKKKDTTPVQMTQRDGVTMILEKKTKKASPDIQAKLEAGKADVHVLTSADKWHGITYREDKPELVEALKKMSEDGLYPVDRLF